MAAMKFHSSLATAGRLAQLLTALYCFAVLKSAESDTAARWRADNRVIDLHQHIDFTPERLTRAVRIMDRAGIGMGVNLSGGTTTQEAGKQSEFERNRTLAEGLFPGKFLYYMNLDYR